MLEATRNREAYYGEGEQPWHKHSKYIDFSNRLDTFEHWPEKSKKCAFQLSEAGFFYAGVRQQVICFSCGKLWTTNKPVEHRKNLDCWTEHALLSPIKKCDYLLSVKGDYFINKAWGDDCKSLLRIHEAEKEREQRKAEREEKKMCAEIANSASSGIKENDSINEKKVHKRNARKRLELEKEIAKQKRAERKASGSVNASEMEETSTDQDMQLENDQFDIDHCLEQFILSLRNPEKNDITPREEN